jgi:hypothetical protein
MESPSVHLMRRCLSNLVGSPEGSLVPNGPFTPWNKRRSCSLDHVFRGPGTDTIYGRDFGFSSLTFSVIPHSPSNPTFLSASIALRPACLRGKARYAVHRLAAQPTAAARSFTSTRFLGSSAGEGTFEDIKVEPYIETRGAKVAHHGECLFCASSRGAAAHGQLTRIRARRQAPADDSKV